ncbi:MAG: galactose-1-epimerase [Succinivibrio sp.]|nr:galactose-1-epimerase [Succinivibrio sp.]
MSDQYAENPQLTTICNQQGMTVTLMDWGATIISLKVPVFGEQESREMLLGVKDPARWNEQGCFFNATIGRYANRIAHNKFTLNGKEYQLNSKAAHTLHGGSEGFDKRRFKLIDKSANSATYVLHSADQDMGFPGNFELTVTYRVEENQTLYVHYLGKCDAACYACITNHAYFNLNGHNSSILGHTLWLDAEEFLPTDADSIPTGEVRSVRGTTFDFTTPKTIGQDFLGDEQQRLSLGYDHPFLIRGIASEPFARVSSDDGRVCLQVFTDYPAVQFYSGNYLNLQHAKVTARDDGKIYFNQSAFCLEPEYYPDAPHLPEYAALNPPVTPQHPLDHFIAYQFKV